MADQRFFDFMQRQLDLVDSINPSSLELDFNPLQDKPFFSSVTLKNEEEFQLEISNGSITGFEVPNKNRCQARLEMRMGSPDKGGSVSHVPFSPALDFGKNYSDKILRETTSIGYWESLTDFEKRVSETRGLPKESAFDEYVYFSKEKSSVFIQDELQSNLDFEKHSEGLRKIANGLVRKWTYDVNLIFQEIDDKSYFLNSEGSKIFTNSKLYVYRLFANAPDKKNLLVPHQASLYSDKPLPLNRIKSEGQRLILELEEILKSPFQGNGLFPTIMDQENTGVLFHEVVGHALEADRIKNSKGEESNIFKDQIGEQVAPSFVNLFDDPTIKSYNGSNLNGHYLYDEEGVKAQRVNLFEKGVLKNYLHSRQSAGYYGINSNGHSRAHGFKEPCSRMGNLFANSSSPVSFDKLKKMLIKECVAQDKKYGLYLQGFTRGWAANEEGVYATYPKNVFRIYPNGKMQRVRGVNVIGTPHITLKNMVAMDDNLLGVNGYCGAESGQIPSSEVSPNSLIKLLEFNRTPSSEYISIYEDVLKNK